MTYINEIFDHYAKYTGSGIFMVLFFVCLVYMAIKDTNENNKSVLLYGSLYSAICIFVPITYYLYITFVDSSTYWRMFWIIPVSVGLAYVGTKLVSSHRLTGLLLVFLVLILSGQFVYLSNPFFYFADNPYKIDQTVMDVCDYLDSCDDDYMNVALPAEFLTQARQYDIKLFTPYGREQLDENWGQPSGFYMAMNAETADFDVLRVKCEVNNTNYIVMNNMKEYVNDPEDFKFVYLTTIGNYEIYRFDGLDDVR